MTHLVIDSTTLTALLTAGDAVTHAADNRLCECIHNVPYSGQVARVLVTKCFRCRAIDEWTAARIPIAKAIFDSSDKGGQAGELSPTAATGVHGSAAGPRVARNTGAPDCEKCHGAGWLRGRELDNAGEDTYADTMTRYSCDGEKCLALRSAVAVVGPRVVEQLASEKVEA